MSRSAALYLLSVPAERALAVVDTTTLVYDRSQGVIAAPRASDTAWSLALTFDDLPMTGGSNCAAAEIIAVNDAILGALEAAQANAAGFVIPGSGCQGSGRASIAGITNMWLDAGHRIGNHSYSHRDYNNLSAQAYTEDLARAHRILEPMLQSRQTPRWFRPPLLHTGPDSARRAALDTWLFDNSYQMGVVTIDNQEWVYASAYARARTSGRADVMNAVADAYVQHIAATTEYSRALAREVFGREIAQVLLLHVNRLNADLLPRVLAVLRDRGARFVSLDQAMSDSAYLTPDLFVGSQGLSWLQRWAIVRGVEPAAEPREDAWVAGYATRGVLPDRVVPDTTSTRSP